MYSYSVLVTNDDGPSSPLLTPLLDCISDKSWCSELRVVVPKDEKSWISKAITRFDTLEAHPHRFGGSHDGFLVTGTPADCTSLGISNLYENKPDIVISGINMGTNAGLAYFLSSGTVAGAAEASLNQVKSVALSAHLPPDIFKPWHDRNEKILCELQEEWKRIASLSVDVVERLILSKAWQYAMLYSVNLPWTTSLTTERKITHITPTFFKKLFTQTGPRQFKHAIDGLEIPKAQNEERGDVSVIGSDSISVTPINYHLTVELPQALISKLEG